VEGLPEDVRDAYAEARLCLSVGAYTACELICRKLLIHVAADKGADVKKGKSFESYLADLEAKGYVTPPMKPWVDLIRKHGNEATHELPPSSEGRAESTVAFTAQLLRAVYEMEYRARQFMPAAQGPAPPDPTPGAK
jgi:hypothetical protein